MDVGGGSSVREAVESSCGGVFPMDVCSLKYSGGTWVCGGPMVHGACVRSGAWEFYGCDGCVGRG